MWLNEAFMPGRFCFCTEMPKELIWIVANFIWKCMNDGVGQGVYLALDSINHFTRYSYVFIYIHIQSVDGR